MITIIHKIIKMDSKSPVVGTTILSHVQSIYTIQGSHKQMRISKILLPTAFATAISAFHFLATIREESRSGTDVHHASIVSAMIT